MCVPIRSPDHPGARLPASSGSHMPSIDPRIRRRPSIRRGDLGAPGPTGALTNVESTTRSGFGARSGRCHSRRAHADRHLRHGQRATETVTVRLRGRSFEAMMARCQVGWGVLQSSSAATDFSIPSDKSEMSFPASQSAAMPNSIFPSYDTTAIAIGIDPTGPRYG